MKTKLLYLCFLTISVFLQGCSTQMTSEEKEPTQKERIEAFIKGEASFFNTFRILPPEDHKYVKGEIIQIEPFIEFNRWSKQYYETGVSVQLDNGKKFIVREENSTYYQELRNNIGPEGGFYIEAWLKNDSLATSYLYYDRKLLKYAAEFYMNGKKKKDPGQCSLDKKNYLHNRFLGEIKNTRKSRVYATIQFPYYAKSVELVYLENGDVLCMSIIYRYYVLNKKDAPQPGQVINYISSDMDGEWDLCNVYDFEIEDYY